MLLISNRAGQFGALIVFGCLGAIAIVSGAVALPQSGTASPGANVSPSRNQVGGVADATISSDAPAARVAAIEIALAQAAALARSSESNALVGIPPQDALVRRGLLQRLVRAYEQQLSNLGELQTAKVRRADLARRTQAWVGFDSVGPHSILLIDNLRQALEAERLRMRADEEALPALNALITENRRVLGRAEEKIRQLNEQLEGGQEPTGFGSLTGQRELEQIRSQVALATVALLDTERQIRQENLAASRHHVELLRKQLVVAEADAGFTQKVLDQVLGNVESDRVRLEDALAKAEKSHSSALAALEAVRILVRPGERPAAESTAHAAELFSTRDAQWDTAVTAVRVLRLQLEALATERTLWELRFAAYGSDSVERLKESERRVQTVSSRVALWKDYFRQKLDNSSSQVAFAETRLSALEPGSEVAPLVRERLQALRERDQWHLSMVRASERLEQLLQRWNDDLQRDLGRLPFGARVKNLFSNTRSFLANLWRFELFTAEDTITVDGQKISGKRSVTVGKILGAILILAVGYWLTGLVSEAGRRFFQRWLHVEPNQGQLIRRWMRATLVVCLVLFSLVSVKIPLTVFAFAGGALAIGIGFGTQTVLKNVVSGLIILFERPFCVGDVLDVGGQKGTLTSIGLRASVLLDLADRLNGTNKLDRSLRTSLDSMSPINRGLLALADAPLGPGITGHSIIPVLGAGEYTRGSDGLVLYSSAHADYVESEFIVRGVHSCLNHPAAIEEVRRILGLHLASLPTGTTNSLSTRTANPSSKSIK